MQNLKEFWGPQRDSRQQFFSRDIYLKKYKNGKVINMGECKSMIMDI